MLKYQKVEVIEICVPLDNRVYSFLKFPVLEGKIRWSGSQKTLFSLYLLHP